MKCVKCKGRYHQPYSCVLSRTLTTSRYDKSDIYM